MYKKISPIIGAVDLYDGKPEASTDEFYGEVVKDGRIHVFSEWVDLKSFLEIREAPHRYTHIGSGPKGETVVYVLNKSNKKKRPDVLIAEFEKNMLNNH